MYLAYWSMHFEVWREADRNSSISRAVSLPYFATSIMVAPDQPPKDSLFNAESRYPYEEQGTLKSLILSERFSIVSELFFAKNLS